MSHSLQLLLLLTIIVVAAKSAAALANRVGQPAVFGEILAGLLLGPTVLDLLSWPMFVPAATSAENAPLLLPFVDDLAQVGVLLLMFIAGLETDLMEMRRVGRVAFWSAFGGVVLPFVGGAATAVIFGRPLFWEGIFVGAILTATSVSISAQTLMEVGALRSKEGSAILGAAVIDDVMGILVLSVVVAFARTSAGGVNPLDIGLVVLRIVTYFGVAILARRWVPALLRWSTDLGVSQGLLAGVLALAFLYAWAAEYVGAVAAITGAYLAGVIVAQTEFKTKVDEGIHPLTYSLLVPVFFISIGLHVNGRELGDSVSFTVAIVLVAIVAKALGCGAFAWLCGFTRQEALRVGAGMISRGEVGLIVAGYGLASGLIDHTVFSACIIMVLATTMVTPPLLRLTFPARIGKKIVVEETIAGPPEETEASRQV